MGATYREWRVEALMKTHTNNIELIITTTSYRSLYKKIPKDRFCYSLQYELFASDALLPGRQLCNQITNA
jgi:hypothetical protein